LIKKESKKKSIPINKCENYVHMKLRKNLDAKKLKTWCKNNNEKFWFWIMVVSMNLKTQFWEKIIVYWFGMYVHIGENKNETTQWERKCVSESDNEFENKIKWW